MTKLCEQTVVNRRTWIRSLLLPAMALITAMTGITLRAEVIFEPHEMALLDAFGPWPAPVPDDPGNEFSGLTWAEQLGEALFNDKSLSGDKSISCTTCHSQSLAFSDGRKVAIGKQVHVRNTQGLLNVGYQRWFGWDGGADSLWAATIRPILSEVEMHGTIPVIAERYRHNKPIQQALKDAGAEIPVTDEQWLVTIAKLIAAYQRTLVSDKTSYDRFRTSLLTGDVAPQQEYPIAARRGMKLFFGEANCHVCHFGANFSNGEFHDTGRPFFTDVGKVDSGRYSGIKRVSTDPYNLAGNYNGTGNAAEIRKTTTVKIGQSNFGQWRTPTLRNLTRTAPYMHDGSLETLRDVVDSYADIDPARLHTQGESILKPQQWSDRERNDLVRFLETLSQ